jgi:hypothetical protein
MGLKYINPYLRQVVKEENLINCGEGLVVELRGLGLSDRQVVGTLANAAFVPGCTL